jgi:hypothetical protein
MANLEREPTADELAGIEWWNSMSEPRRADWLQLADSARPADAWAEFKRRSLDDQTGATSAG